MKQSDFHPVTAADRPLFLDFLQRFPTPSCERAWANLRLYCDSYDWHYAIVDGHLVTVSFRSGHVQYPLGEELPPGELAELLQDVSAAGGWVPGCYDLPAEYMARHPDAEQIFHFEEDPGEADYLYDLDHLLSLSGSRLRKKHNQIRQFERDFGNCSALVPLTADNLGEVLALARQLNGFQTPSESIAEENLALQRLEREFADPTLALAGVVLTVRDRTAGFSIYSPLDETMADIHFEKASREFRNAGTMLTYQLAGHLRERNFTRMNREQDLNDDGLRQAKHSWDPGGLYRRGSLTLRARS